jgi:hypothetical protein
MLRTFAICFASLACSGMADQETRPLIFSSMGCGPYTGEDAAAIRHYISNENKTKTSAFLIHLGDINSGAMARQGKLTESYYSFISKLLTNDNKIPTYIVPGDNEWNDRPDPDVGWTHWMKHLGSLENNFAVEWKTARQKIRPENFAFSRKGTLVIGINLVGGRVHDRKEWTRRFRENNDWIQAQFNAHRKVVDAAVVCCQANPIGQGKGKTNAKAGFEPFCNRFGELCAAFGKPVLFLHADGHKWIVDKPWKTALNITRVQLDRINAKFPPVQITIDPKAKNPFSFDRRLEKPDWKIPPSAKPEKKSQP